MAENIKPVTNRKSNIELIRILAMIMIVMDHYVQHGLTQMTENISASYAVISHFFGCFGQIGVSLFFLITGYFMVNSGLRLKSIIKIILNTLFYSYIIGLLFITLFPNQITFMKIYQTLLPVSTAQYWFVTTYIVIYILSPLFNFIINNIPKDKLDIYMYLFFILWFAIRPFTYNMTFAGDITLLSIFIYMCGAYIKKYGIQFFESKNNRLAVYIISLIFVIGWLIICHKYTADNRILWFKFSRLGSIFTLFPAISIFYYFKDLNLDYNKWINMFAASAFSVYLITENIWLRKILWTKIFHCCDFSSTTYMICNILIAVTVSYLICTIIDRLKDKLFFNRLCEYITECKLYKFIDNKFFTILNK